MSILIKGMEMPTSCNACMFDVYGLCLINKNIEGKDALTHSCPLIPVPPHGRLIDADSVKRGIEELKQSPWYNEKNLDHFPIRKEAVEVVEHLCIDKEPTMEAVPVVHGKWVIDGEFIDCSVCKREKWSRVPYEDLVKRFRFCPNCGAKMGGERKDDERS